MSQYGREISRIIIGVILARLLSPEEYGLLGMVVVLTGFAKIFIDFTFGPALIQRSKITDKDLSTVFWINIFTGAALTLLFYTCAGLIAEFYNDPQLVKLTQFLSILFILGSFNVVQRVLFTKELNFKVLAKANIAATLLSGIIAIILAYTGFGVWSLAIQMLSVIVIEGIILWISSTWRPRWEFSRESLRSMSSFSLALLGEKVLNYMAFNLDNVLIGKYIGKADLGVYNRAFSFVVFPVSNISGVIGKVMFPSLSMIQDDKERVGRIYLNIIQSISYISIPLLFSIFVVADNFVLVLFGEQWRSMIPFVRIFSLIGVFASVSSMSAQVLISQGKPQTLLRLSLIHKPIIIAGTFVGLAWGAWGIALAKLIISAIFFFISLEITGRSIGLSLKRQVWQLAPTTGISLLLAGILYIADTLMADIPGIIALSVEVVLGALSLWGLSVLFKIAPYYQIKQILTEKFLSKTRGNS